MPHLLLLLALSFAHPAGSPCALAGPACDRGEGEWLVGGPSTDGTGRRGPAGMDVAARAPSSGMLSAWDDEVEIPDEPEDDSPDDPGDAHAPGHNRIENLGSPAPVARIVVPAPWLAGSFARIEPAIDSPFLRLCRLQF